MESLLKSYERAYLEKTVGSMIGNEYWIQKIGDGLFVTRTYDDDPAPTPTLIEPAKRKQVRGNDPMGMPESIQRIFWKL